MKFNKAQHFFANVPQAQIPRSQFKRNSALKTTLNEGWLVPIFVDEVLPGDTFNLKMMSFGRLATPIRPIMDNMYLDTFFFFVPNRLVWNNFQKFMGEQDNPSDSTSFLVPTMTPPAGGYIPNPYVASPTAADLAGALNDYLGLPTRVAFGPHNSLVHRSYNLIWNQWFRDQNLQVSAVVDKGDGPDTYTNYVLRKRGKRHDYFTSALPWPQKGIAVSLPLGTQAPIVANAAFNGTTGNTNVFNIKNPAGVTKGLISGGSGGFVYGSASIAGDGSATLYADLTAATAATINQLRQAFQIQKLYERDARGGTRYTEIIHSHFGVTSPDARLQRPEYLGGGEAHINFTPIAQTSAVTGQPTPQGNVAAMATFGFNGGRHGFVKSFTEHGYIIGLASIRADMTYQYGLNKMWSRQTRFDFYWPVLSHIGEQAIFNKEIYAQGTSADNDVFGYQERYGEYRYKPSLITGKFRSNDPQTLDSWHLAQKFTALPTLSDAFIQENPDVGRIVAVPSEPHFLMDCGFELTTARPMPLYGVPSMIDHF